MRTRRIALVLVVLLGLALAPSGCALKKKATASSRSTTSKSTSTKSTTSTNSTADKADTGSSTTKKITTDSATKSSAITAVGSGTKERTALLNAARAKLNSSTQLYVYQLYEQGDTALGDLKPLTTSAGERSFYAFTKSGGKWKVAKSWTNGSSSATASKVVAALPVFSKELVAKINWSAKESSAGSKKSSSTVKSELSSAAKGWAKSAMDGQGSPYKIVLAKVAKDGNGTWWGRAIAEPTGSYERIEFWAKYGSTSWSGKAQDPEPPAPSTYFPSSVISSLGL
jgi:hypothetical protein